MDDNTAEWRNSMERRIGALETDVAVIRSNYATKQDLAALEMRLVKWFVATAAAMSLVSFSAALTVARMLG
jgi:predicted fused transcriptional regulator/phosphomethylpyrimidine kinase